MKLLVTICRLLVGLLFIFSGLVKANDPHGLSYKMQEYFEVWGMHGYDHFTLGMSILMNAFEIIAGAAILLGWWKRLFTWLLLLMIIAFTFLTGYTYRTGQPVNCGCFGDCLLISSKTSFLKDVVLLIMIAILCGWQRYIQPILPSKINIVIMLLVTAASFGLQWYALNYLPPVDCLPFRKGKNITEQMKRPANAIPDSTVITFVYKKDGKDVEFTSSSFPADFNDSYVFQSRYDKIIRKGSNNEPPIKGFTLKGSYYTDSTGEQKINDSTGIVLTQPYAILLFCENFSVPVSKWKDKMKEIYSDAQQKNIPVYLVTTTRDSAVAIIQSTGMNNIQVFNSDMTVIHTAARTNPCLYLLKEGTILGKWSYRTMEAVKKQLDSIQAAPKQVLAPIVIKDTARHTD